jgi:hypothetical protein
MLDDVVHLAANASATPEREAEGQPFRLTGSLRRIDVEQPDGKVRERPTVNDPRARFPDRFGDGDRLTPLLAPLVRILQHADVDELLLDESGVTRHRDPNLVAEELDRLEKVRIDMLIRAAFAILNSSGLIASFCFGSRYRCRSSGSTSSSLFVTSTAISFRR